MHRRTTFIIAHRPSTLENCDVLLKIEDGQVFNISSLTPPAIRQELSRIEEYAVLESSAASS
jgi:ABC-type bacteriocin/lantibiotic exporter with double-glycine peptidase domain